jgi:hypothetical protein
MMTMIQEVLALLVHPKSVCLELLVPKLVELPGNRVELQVPKLVGKLAPIKL